VRDNRGLQKMAPFALKWQSWITSGITSDGRATINKKKTRGKHQKIVLAYKRIK
jgi:hypothetical protein